MVLRAFSGFRRCTTGLRFLRASRELACACLLPLVAVAAAGPAFSAESPLNASVTLSRNSLRAGSTVDVAAWLGNTGDEPMDVELIFGAADSVQLGLVEEQPAASQDAARRVCTIVKNSRLHVAVRPHDVAPLTACLHAKEDVTEGSLSISFTFLGRSRVAGRPRVDVTTVEKSVTLGLLGTEDVGGFSLRLVTLVLPGLILLGLLRFFAVPKVADLNSAEQGAIAVLVSAGLVYTAERLWPPGEPGGVSLTRLAWLCGACVLAGLVAGVPKLVRHLRSLKLVGPEDDVTRVLRKVLPRRGPQPNVEITLQTGERFRGSCLGRTIEGFALIGWFQYRIPQGSPHLDQLRRLANAVSWRALITAGQKRDQECQLRNAVKRLDGQGWVDTDNWIRRWTAVEIQRSVEVGQPEGPPLRLEEI
jgi:hypothetical protein